MKHRPILRWTGIVVLGFVPVGVAAAWIPLRNQLPNTDAALLIVLSVAAVATVRGRPSGFVGSLAGVAAFDFFDTAPYGQFFMTRMSDSVTTAILLGASLLVAGLAASLRNYRGVAARTGADFTVMASAARLVSVGEAASVVVSALAGELVSRLDLQDCEFHYGPPAGDRVCITRDGKLAGADRKLAGADGGPVELDLPVWSGEDVRGYYRLVLKTDAPPAPDRLVAAVGIGEQAGAALAGQLVDPGPPGDPASPTRPRRLRLVR